MRIVGVGHALFASTMIALGILGLVKGDFAAIWEPMIKGVPARETLAYLCAAVSLTCGVGLFWRRTAALAAGALLGYLLVWLLFLKVPAIFLKPASQDSWSGCGETAVIVAGAWVLYAWFAAERERPHFAFATGDKGFRIARALYALALIPFGVAHFNFINETAALIPNWIPFHLALAYFTGGAFIAAGLAMLVGVYARLAAALSTFQMGMFTLLVWIPIIATGSFNDFQWNETVISWTLTIAAWAVTDSYRGTPWLAVRGG
jgi:uncharacterized membrane protein